LKERKGKERKGKKREERVRMGMRLCRDRLQLNADDKQYDRQLMSQQRYTERLYEQMSKSDYGTKTAHLNYTTDSSSFSLTQEKFRKMELFRHYLTLCEDYL